MDPFAIELGFDNDFDRRIEYHEPSIQWGGSDTRTAYAVFDKFRPIAYLFQVKIVARQKFLQCPRPCGSFSAQQHFWA